MDGRDADRLVIEAHAGLDRIALIVRSHRRLTGRDLVPSRPDDAATARALWHLPAVVLAHGTEGDPRFFYANRAALVRFAMAADTLIDLPSRLSAEAPERGERERLLTRVAAEGYIDDYAGLRVAATGQRFLIGGATVWNLVDESGERHGQAATFAEWKDL